MAVSENKTTTKLATSVDFFSLEHLEATVGLLISVCCVSENRKAWGEGGRWGNGWSVGQSEHTQHLSIEFTVLYGSSLWCPKAITTPKTTDDRSP